jgi:hypothetical protein
MFVFCYKVACLLLERRINREQTKEMNCNRPFLFVVFDDVTKLVLCSAVLNSVELGAE